MLSAPSGEGGPVAQVGPPGVLRQGGGERLPHALRVRGGQRGRGGGVGGLREGKLSHNGDYRTAEKGRAEAVRLFAGRAGRLVEEDALEAE